MVKGAGWRSNTERSASACAAGGIRPSRPSTAVGYRTRRTPGVDERETAMPDQIQGGDLYGPALSPGVWNDGSGCRVRNVVGWIVCSYRCWSLRPPNVCKIYARSGIVHKKVDILYI